MKRIQLEIKVLSPLAISRQKPGGSVSECEDYIPGSVIRGAIASEILKQSGQQFNDLSKNGGDFQALFLSDESAIFQNAYPSIKTKGKLITRGRIEEIKVLPATAFSSKNKPGFKTESKNGVFDTLIDRFCAEYYGFAYEPTCPQEKDGRVEPYTGFYSKYNSKYYNLSVSKRLLTRVGINRRRATSEEDILYSVEVISESQSRVKNPTDVIYKSAILVSSQLSKSLHKFVDDHRQTFRLGGSTSRGLGKVHITPQQPEDTPNIVEQKIQDFNSKLQFRWQQYSVFGNPIKELPNRTYFTLDLQADAILREQWRRTTVISAQMLGQFANIEDESLQLEVAYSSYDYRSGWNAAWGLMKDVELVTDKGSVYLFSTTQPEIWYEVLAELELKGVGDRTCEGFGQVEVCNDFHLVLREDAV
ncbi:CRISPR-associated RAMP protein Csx10 [Nostoc sp. CENA67]|uniref:CRISPR-associated RAMP protein Csx10 n=1 Tax=Amazonocrinis nigriterrae CENA67 TaxID=2794033 RepID=A0A8J7I1H2_9NOST|nr:CRISPR-associated RAMP protein Csx10 [Amazonocrinis nigriterrae]MBH8566564.1 CRISPR-associated RAMP protein Csx10 [Amazonocrinis nigriterrae CENA67]